MTEQLTPAQQRRIDDIREFQRVMQHVRKLVTELDSSRAAKATIVTNISATIARELSQLRQRALTANIGTLGDVAGALAVLAGRSGGGINLKIRGLLEGVNSLDMQLDQALKAAMAPEKDKKSAP